MVPLRFKKIHALQCSMVFQVHRAVQWTPKPCFERCGHLVFNTRGQGDGDAAVLWFPLCTFMFYLCFNKTTSKKKKKDKIAPMQYSVLSAVKPLCSFMFSVSFPGSNQLRLSGNGHRQCVYRSVWRKCGGAGEAPTTRGVNNW